MSITHLRTRAQNKGIILDQIKYYILPDFNLSVVKENLNLESLKEAVPFFSENDFDFDESLNDCDYWDISVNPESFNEVIENLFGEDLDRAETERIVHEQSSCKNCGKRLSDFDRYCSNCGTKR